MISLYAPTHCDCSASLRNMECRKDILVMSGQRQNTRVKWAIWKQPADHLAGGLPSGKIKRQRNRHNRDYENSSLQITAADLMAVATQASCGRGCSPKIQFRLAHQLDMREEVSPVIP